MAIEEFDVQIDTTELSVQEKKAIVKKSITTQIGKELKNFIKQYDVEKMDSYYEDFLRWLEKYK